MTLHVENEISDYWSINKTCSKHPISKVMARNRFQELYIRVRYSDLEAQEAYKKNKLLYSTLAIYIY